MSKSKGEQWAQAEAWYRLWPVLQELGVDEKCPDMSGCRAAITFVRGLAEERDKLAREVRLLRTELHTLGNELTKEYSDRDKWHAARPHLRQMGYDALAFGSPEAIQVADDDGATT